MARCALPIWRHGLAGRPSSMVRSGTDLPSIGDDSGRAPRIWCGADLSGPHPNALTRRHRGGLPMAQDRDKPASIAHIWAQAAHDLRQPVQAALLLAGGLDASAAPAELKRNAKHIDSALRSLDE